MTISDIKAGKQGFFVMMSTAVIASGTVASPYMVPDGDIVTLMCTKINDMEKSTDRRKPSGSKRTFKHLAERLDIVMHMKDCYIVPTEAADAIIAGDNPWGIALPSVTAKSATANLKILKEWCFDHGVKIGGSRVYLFAWNNAEGEWYPMSWNFSDVMLNYLEGNPLLPQDETESGGKMYKLASFVFEGVNTG